MHSYASVNRILIDCSNGTMPQHSMTIQVTVFQAKIPDKDVKCLNTQRTGTQTNTMKHAVQLAIIRTIMLVPFHVSEFTATHLTIGYIR